MFSTPGCADHQTGTESKKTCDQIFGMVPPPIKNLPHCLWDSGSSGRSRSGSGLGAQMPEGILKVNKLMSSLYILSLVQDWKFI